MYRTPTILQKLFPNRIWSKPSKEKTVYLTFDDGPNEEITAWLLAFLQQENILATFFCVGENVQKHFNLFQQIVKDGHAVGNHTMRHENAVNVSKAAYLASVSEAQEVIESNLFRPPYGRLSKWKEKQLPKELKVIMWTWLSFDYDNSKTSREIIAAADKIKSGDILLFHDSEKTKDRLKIILPKVVEKLKGNGFSFAVIS